MRLGLISDVHGNLAALQVAMAALEREGVTEVLCAGDVVGYGPQPNECIALLAQAGVTCVAGNHDLLALGLLDGSRSGALARTTMQWTRRSLGSAEHAFLSALPLVVHRPGLVMAHGSLDDPETYVWPGPLATDELRLMEQRWPSARFLVLGHTHKQAVFGQVHGAHRLRGGSAVRVAGPERFLINPGSVGQSRDRERRPRVRFAVLDLGQDLVTPWVTGYDAAKSRRLLRREGLPERAVHLRPSRRTLARRVVRRSRAAVNGLMQSAGRGRA